MINLTKVAINNNRVTWAVLITIAILGLLIYGKMPREDMPPFTIRVASVVTRFPGAGPERVESLITDKIEKKAQEIPEVKHITSESRTGLSVVSIELKDDVSKVALQPIWDRLRRKIDEIKSELPTGIEGPNIKDDDIGVVYGIMLGITSDGFEYSELKDFADDIRDELIKLPDAARVDILGAQEEQIFIEFDNTRLARIGLTAGKLQNIIAATNIIIPGGEVILEDERIILEPTGSYETLADLAKTLIPVGENGDTVYLGDISKIDKGYQSPPKRLISINGEKSLVLAISLKKGANIIKLGEEIDRKTAKINKSIPLGLQLRRVASQDIEVDKSVKDFISNLLQSVGIVLVVMLVFLGFRTGLVVASLIPMTIVMTLLIIGMLGIGINKVTLAALIMALGMLVDNAIVVSESIMVKMETGQKALAAAIESSKELSVPLLVSSLTTSAAFLAFYLAESVMGEIVGPLFVVITIALLSSWCLALTLIPMLAVIFIKVKKKRPDEKQNSFFDKLNGYYQKLLLVVLKRPFIFILLIIGLFAGSLYLFRYLPFVFFPDSERNLVTVDLNLPLGTRIETTKTVVSQIEDYIKKELLMNETRDTGIRDWAAFIGEGPASYDLGYQPGEANSGYAHILLNTRSGEDNQMVIDKLYAWCFRHLPDADVKVKRLSGGGGGGIAVQIRVSGNSPAELFRISEKIKQKLSRIPGTKNIDDDWGPKIKKLVIDIDTEKAQRAGMNNQDIAVSLQTELSGYNTGVFREGDKTLAIMLKSEESDQLDVADLESINIFAQNSGKNVPLVQVAKIVPEWQYATIKRRDLFRTITINCYIKGGYTASDINKVLTPWLETEATTWKAGYTFEAGGEAEDSAEAMGAVIDQLPVSGFIILILLITQFNSFRKTTIVLSTIPLALIGVVVGLLAFRSTFGFFAFLGLISLAGIVINNAIVLIDRIQLELGQFNRSPKDAVIMAATQRFRPIILTTFTTALGLIPLYLGGGLMWEPMAVAIMIGLLFATVITLLFVPVLYRLLFRVAI